MTKTKKNLEARALTISQLIINNEDLYHLSGEGERGLLETLVGAAIWYLPNTPELFTGKISREAFLKIQDNPKATKLVEEHAIPRKVAGKLLFTTYLEDLKKDPSVLMSLYLESFGKYNLVLKEENDRLKKYQKSDVFVTEEEAYAKAGIELMDFSYEAYQEFKRIKTSRSKRKVEFSLVVTPADLNS